MERDPQGRRVANGKFKIWNELDFVKKDVCFAVCREFAPYEFPSGSIVGKGIDFRIFKIDRDNVFFGDTFCRYFFAKKFKKSCFSGTADAGYNLYDVHILPRIKPSKIIRPCYFCCYVHKNFSPVKVFCGMLAIFVIGVKRALEGCCGIGISDGVIYSLLSTLP